MNPLKNWQLLCLVISFTLTLTTQDSPKSEWKHPFEGEAPEVLIKRSPNGERITVKLERADTGMQTRRI